MKKEQIKVMISKVKNKIWLFLKKIYAKLPEKMKVHIRKLKPKEKIKGEYRGSDRAEEMPVLKVSPNRNWIRLFWVLLVISIILGIYNNFTSVDTVTVEKETVIEEKLKDTNALESYVKVSQVYIMPGKIQTGRSAREKKHWKSIFRKHCSLWIME